MALSTICWIEIDESTATSAATECVVTGTSTAILVTGLTLEIINKSWHLPLLSRRERRHSPSRHLLVELVHVTLADRVRDADNAKLLQPLRVQQALQIPANAQIALVKNKQSRMPSLESYP